MGETSIHKLPFPDDEDAPDGPTQIEALADALDVLKWGSRNLKPTIGLKVAESDLSLTEAFQDVTLTGGNLVITPAVASTLLVVATFASQSSGDILSGTVRLNSTDQTALAIAQTAGSTAAQVYVLSLEASVEYTVKLRAKRAAISTTLEADHTRMIYALFAS